MSSQVSPLEKIHTGLWTDYTNGSIQGLTLSVTAAQGAYLIAFLAIFVRIAGGHFWDILCYLWFHLRASRTPHDGLYHQQQALLRNNLSDNRAIWQFSALAWAWRRKTSNPILRSLPFIAVAALHFAAFTLAGIFASKVTGVRSSVLISGPICGPWPDEADVFDQRGMVQQAQQSGWIFDIWRTSSVQATSCHTFNTSGPSQFLQDCKAFGRDFVSWTVKDNVPCPFAEEMCVDGLSVELQTTLIDSHMHLGINSPRKDRVQFRNTMQCAPIKIKGFKSQPLNWTETGLSDDYIASGFADFAEGYTGYSYGPETLLGINYTFVYYNTTFGNSLGNLQGASYMIDSEFSMVESDDGTFQPIPQLNRTNADVDLKFIMNSHLQFVEPSNDPIFGATVQEPSTVIDPTGNVVNVSYYLPSEPVSVLGCAQQWQYCNPNIDDPDQRCSEATGMDAVSIAHLNFTPTQMGVYNRINTDIHNSVMYLMIVALGNEGLLASTYSNFGMAGSKIPDDQWMRELDHWYGMYWISLQLHTAQFAVGNGVQAQDQYRVRPSREDKWMCNAQMVQRSDYSSFNMLGVLLILCFGAVFILLNSTLDPIVRSWAERNARRAGVSYVSSWRAHHLLQLQSRAFGALGIGDWKHDNLVPTTSDADHFAFPFGTQGEEKLYAQISPALHRHPQVTFENKLPVSREWARDTP